MLCCARRRRRRQRLHRCPALPPHHAQEAFQLLVTASKGFTWRPERPTAPTFVEQVLSSRPHPSPCPKGPLVLRAAFAAPIFVAQARAARLPSPHPEGSHVQSVLRVHPRLPRAASGRSAGAVGAGDDDGVCRCPLVPLTPPPPRPAPCLLLLPQKWGWTGLAVGDWAELVLDTRADGKGVRAEKDGKKVKANIWLSYLRSYTVGGVGVGSGAAVRAGQGRRDLVHVGPATATASCACGRAHLPPPPATVCSTWAWRAWSAGRGASARTRASTAPGRTTCRCSRYTCSG